MKFTVAMGYACWISVANAILYPILPIANSVFNGGSQNTISWIDTGSKPSLADMGPISLDLYIDRPNSVSACFSYSSRIVCHFMLPFPLLCRGSALNSIIPFV